MNARLSKLLSWGLIALVGGLFIATFLLNQKQYTASISTAEASLRQTMVRQAEVLRQQLDKVESDLFALAQTDRILDADLFIVQDDCVVPACTAGLLETVPRQAADAASEKGIALLPSPEALLYLQTAAKRPIENPDDLYRKTAALLNMLELEPNVQMTCCILTLLGQSDPALTTAQRRFFRTMLEEQIADPGKIETRLHALRETAAKIDRNLTRRKGAYRDTIDGKTLSVTKNGLALLYSPHMQATAPVELSTSPPNGLHHEIVPGLFASIPDTIVEQAKASIRQQYKTGNAIIGLLLLLGTGLAFGLVAMNRRQRQLAAMRTEFIATVSHELRTPLSLIRLHAETLKHGRIPQNRVADYHQSILTEAERLTGIVNNVLDFSRMERNKLQIHPEPTNLSALCEQIVESFQDRLEQDDFKLEKQVETGITCMTDPLAFSQIVFNLMDNAIKYSDNEKVIRIELTKTGERNTLRVADSGIGIPDRLKKHIFDEFVRSTDSKVTARRGSGIGLNVVHRLLDLMGGTIEISDNQPKGSVFTVQLGDCNEATGG